MADCKYTFSDSVKTVTLHSKNEAGILVPTEVQAIFPFGIQSGAVTEDKLTDSMVEYLSVKDEYKNSFIEKEISNKKSKSK